MICSICKGNWIAISDFFVLLNGILRTSLCVCVSVCQSCPAFSNFMVYHKAPALAGIFFTSVPPGETPRTNLLWQPYCLKWVCWGQLESRKGIKQIYIVPTAFSFLVSPCLWHLTLLKSSDHLQNVPEFEFSVVFFFLILFCFLLISLRLSILGKNIREIVCPSCHTFCIRWYPISTWLIADINFSNLILVTWLPGFL